ncbi:UDP-N-acetylmuramoyl-tripeptide--D-alanyl-D-alanine ligase [Roseobacter sinensis]|uniref:UDP-N-acetylmuramoyl-tripeptide--D-alanyl-D-alanine ligase n=1 Tax=Roseobacter sinensis TaxID=2931391 RepID=A0ABT3BGI5_9RHOB|nr:UDP-N-acetylmuramoyl-tripeptide--D-alanyl-D-alanine ligase [Roseobacter sp. WL0113]MCV3272686.1 UDP-N-acetylmuramoyl-tripeptide--D-alanyl-D-alanine ligase [Roseobacter sp. WL0113]
MSLWNAADAVAATGGKSSGDWTATGVSIDTRTLEPGDLFVALKDQRDGHEFVAQALEKGAAAALVSHRPADVSAAAPLLIVDDVLKGLESLGRAARARMHGKVAAVTGSVGKTSTKEMLREMLAVQGRTHASVASYNNHWGVPLTLARMPRDTDFAVIEIGMNHPGEIAPLAKMAEPHVALVTTVAAAHLEAFDDITGIAVEKASIYEGVVPGGVAVLNADIDTAAILMAKAQDCRLRDISFGEHGYDFKLIRADLQDDTTVVQAEMGAEPLLYKIASPGRHFAMNALGALAVVAALRADIALAVGALGRWKPYKGRGQRERIHLDAIEVGMTLDLIDDSYNANPTSMAAALDVLAAAPVTNDIGRVSRGRRIAFLGDMKELGPDEGALHAGLAQLPSLQSLDVVHCIGPLMRSLYDVLPEAQRGDWFETAEEALPRLKRRLDSGDVVLAKGSLSMKLGLIVDAIREMGHAPPGDEEG